MKKLLICAISMVAFQSFAQNAGDLDTSFGSLGIVIASQGEAPYDVVNHVVQSDGKTIIIGNYDLADSGFITRFNADGSRDMTFNSGNILHFDNVLNVTSVGLQSDGKIVVGGSAFNNYAFLTRLTVTGAIDPTFGTNGYTIINYSQDSYWHILDLKILPDNKIVSIHKDIFQNPNHFEVVRFTANGGLDTSFNGNGLVLIDSTNSLYGGDLFVQADGKLVISGNYSADGINTTGFFITRLNGDGSYDTAFNSGTIKFVSGSDQVNSFTVQPDGKIITSCFTGTQAKTFRYNSNGSTDLSFNATGVVTRAIPYYTGTEFFQQNYSTVRLQADGKIVVVTGYNTGANTSSGKNFDIAILRYNSNGTVDNSFDTDGLALVSFYGLNDYGYNFDIHNNKYIISGNTFQSFFEKRIAICSVNQDGTLDTAFDTDGKNTMLPARSAIAHFTNSEMQADGKIVLSGNQFVASNDIGNSNFTCLTRHNADGSIDASFGTAGKTIVNVLGNSATFKLQNDGKIVLAIDGALSGTSITRLNTNGTLDTAFGTGGSTLLTNQTFGDIRSIAMQSDGKIVLAGNRTNSPTPSTENFYLARLNTNGSFDSTFGTSGSTTNGSTAFRDYLTSVKIQADGKIVAAGSVSNGADTDIAVLRYNSNGTLDTSFNGNGVYSQGVGTADDNINTIEIQSDGKIIGTAGGNTGNVLFRITSSGSADTTFDTDGMVSTPFRGSGLKVLSDQRILICGTVNDDFTLSKYNANGSIDTGFGTNGMVTTDIDNNDSAFRVMVTNDGTKAIVAGDSGDFTGEWFKNSFSMARYYLNNELGTPSDAINGFSFYPNPAKDKITLNENIHQATIYTLDGKKINTTLRNDSIDLSAVANGIYLIEMKDNQGRTATKKLIKE